MLNKDHNKHFQESRKEKNQKIEKLFKPKEISEKKFLPATKSTPRPEPQTTIKAIYSWKAKEFEKIHRHPNWYLYFYIILFAISIFSLFTDNLLLAILIILFGLIFYLLEKRDPKTYSFGITKEGVFAQDNLYPFSSIENFWIFYEPNGLKELSLKNKKHLLPYTQIPLGKNANPSKIKEILINFIPEEEREQNIFDYIERFF